ncbi:hypothetical protein BRDID11002_61600 [Bradyrhizobium diazoefficiens]
MQFELGIEVAHGSLRGGDIGAGLIERRLEVAIVDPGQHLAGLDLFVVATRTFAM